MQLFINITDEEEGSALITVLIITVIISVLILGILGTVYVQTSFIQRDIDKSKALYTAEEGVFRLLDSVANQKTTKIDTIIYTHNNRIELTLEPFGGVYNIHSKTSYGAKKLNLNVIVGEKATKVFNNALVIGDTTSALNVTGSTIINGDIVSGKGGVRESSFKGFPFSGKIEGESFEIGKDFNFPEFDTRLFEEFIKDMDELLQKRDYPSIKVFSRKKDLFSWTLTGDTVFFDKNLTVEVNEKFSIPANKTLLIDGNLIVNGELKVGEFSKIVSSDSVLVSGKIEGSDFITYAENLVEIGGISVAKGQFLSSGRIKIKDNTYLQYPSVIYTSSEYFDGKEPEVILISDQAKVDGTLLYPVENNSFTRDLFRVKIEEGANVKGGVYTLSQTELKGKIQGTIATNQLYFYESPTTYINWLKDISIDVEARPENYIVPIGFSDTTRYAILNWLVEEL